MKTDKYLLHKCGHQCLVSLDHNRHFVKFSKFVCYACKDLPGTETCRSCKVRGEWLERQKDSAIAKTDPRV